MNFVSQFGRDKMSCHASRATRSRQTGCGQGDVRYHSAIGSNSQGAVVPTHSICPLQQMRTAMPARTHQSGMLEPPEFLLFDLGNVLVHFDHRVACQQLQALLGGDEQQIWEVLFERGLEREYESGMPAEAFCQRLREAFSSEASDRMLLEAHADIFTLSQSMVPLVNQLSAAGHALGILSNTCSSHWQHCCRKFRLVRTLFETTVLSFEVGAMKPDPAIFHKAVERVGVAPARILFVDDLQQNVEIARAMGFDAILYSSAREFCRELMARQVSLNF
ncbi:MAG: hypothetical protein CMJ75_13845 [Planctomycetaceae bacterium]|nr:hypothetical protein [Planctomycetaceae bacterium]